MILLNLERDPLTGGWRCRKCGAVVVDGVALRQCRTANEMHTLAEERQKKHECRGAEGG